MGVSPTGRPVLTVALDEATHDRLRALADAEGVTVAALVEAFARALTAPQLVADKAVGSRRIAEARAIDVERRRRGRHS